MSRAGSVGSLQYTDGSGWEHEGDLDFIAHARTDLPAALDDIDRLKAELDEARDAYAWRLDASDQQARDLRTLTAERDALQARLDEATATIDDLHERVADLERRTGERSGGV
jgi:septal ring factor EnvC (AmiA/AmiB activator)